MNTWINCRKLFNKFIIICLYFNIFIYCSTLAQETSNHSDKSDRMEDQYELFVDNYSDKKDFLKLLKILAEQGNPFAQYHFATVYYYGGYGVNKDYILL
jgi:hypothetical protein